MRINYGLVHADVVGLIDRAQKRMVLISPYVEPWPGLVLAIERAAARGVDIYLVARGGDDRSQQEKKIRPLKNNLAYLGFVERLHAKIYLNEDEALITSMNLHQSSALNSLEVSAQVSKVWSAKEYAQLRRICDSILDTADQDDARAAEAEEESAPRQQTASKRRKQPAKGFCIRCVAKIAYDENSPLCDKCHAIWARFKNKDYEEEYCHQCGAEAETTFREPLCEDC